MNYEFFLRYRLSDSNHSHDELLEKLGDSGCTDALVGLGAASRLVLEFSRKNRSARLAIQSALNDVRRAIPDVELIEVGPDFVGLTDVASNVGVSRQNLRQLMITHIDSFPLPVHEGGTSIWHLHDLLLWFRQRKLYDIRDEEIEIAKVTMHINWQMQEQTKNTSVLVSN